METLNEIVRRNAKAIRLKKSMTQEIVSVRMEIDQATYSRLERGRNGISVRTLEKLAHALQVHPAMLLKDEK